MSLALLLLSITLSAPEKYRVEAQGWELTIPSGWKHSEQGGRLLLGSDTEAGLIIAWFAPGATWEQMKTDAANGIQDPSVQLSPLGAAEEKKLGKNRALVANLKGMGSDGVEVRARAIGVLLEAGAVGVVGLTTAEKIAGLAKTVEAIAASVKYEKPKAGAGTSKLKAALCSFSGGNVATTTRRMVFDGNGNVGYGAETIAGGTFKDGAGNTTGSWGSASGNQYDANSRGRYSVDGDRVTIVWANQTETCSVHFRQQDGRITELQCGSTLYGTSLCE